MQVISTKYLRAIIALLLLNLVVTGYLVFTVHTMDSRVDSLEDRSELVEDYIVVAGDLQKVGSEPVKFRSNTGWIVAYDSEKKTGVLFEYEYRPIPGDDIYVETSELLISYETQQSFKNAQKAVQKSSYHPQTYGLVIEMDAPEAWEFITGGSAGVEIATQIAATDPRYERNNSVAVTGRVTEDGRVLAVDRVADKAVAARDNGKKKLVTPVQPFGAEPEGIEVVEVTTLEEALDHALVRVNSTE